MEYNEGYNRMDSEDFNFCAYEDELSECVNDDIDTEKIRQERNNLIFEVFNKLGSQNFMRLTDILSSCVYLYYPDKEKIKECQNFDYHHCCECWEKVIREMKG